MKIPVQLKNIGGNIPENDIALQVSYFIKSQNDELLPQSDAYIAPALGKIDASFGNNLARNKDVFFAVISNADKKIILLNVKDDNLV
ncbi:TPA: hypothetical protein ACGAF4_002243 [Legionella pneumophila]